MLLLSAPSVKSSPCASVHKTPPFVKGGAYNQSIYLSRLFLTLCAHCFAVYYKRLTCSFYGLLRDHTALDRVIGRNLIHDIHHNALHDGTQTSGSCLSLQRFLGDRIDRIRLEGKLHIVKLKKLLILLDQGTLRLL